MNIILGPPDGDPQPVRNFIRLWRPHDNAARFEKRISRVSGRLILETGQDEVRFTVRDLDPQITQASRQGIAFGIVDAHRILGKVLICNRRLCPCKRKG